MANFLAALVGLTLTIVLFPITIPYLIKLHNDLVKRGEGLNEVQGAIAVQEKRRTDVYQRIVALVRSMVEDEKEVWKIFGNARNYAAGIAWIQERYPQIAINKDYTSLLLILNRLEDDLMRSRDKYNAAVREWNAHVKVFPRNLFCALLGARPKKYIVP